MNPPQKKRKKKLKLSLRSTITTFSLYHYLILFWNPCRQLSMWRCSDELRVHADELHRSSKKDAKHYIGLQYLLQASKL